MPSTCERSSAAERQFGADEPDDVDEEDVKEEEPGTESILDEAALDTAADRVVDDIKKLSSESVRGLLLLLMLLLLDGSACFNEDDDKEEPGVVMVGSNDEVGKADVTVTE